MATVSSKLVPAAIPNKAIPDEKRRAISNTEAVDDPSVQVRDRNLGSSLTKERKPSSCEEQLDIGVLRWNPPRNQKDRIRIGSSRWSCLLTRLECKRLHLDIEVLVQNWVSPRCKSAGTCPGALASASAAARHAHVESAIDGAIELPH